MSVSGWGATLGTTSIDASGAFSLSFTVPSTAALGAAQLQFSPTCMHSTYIPFVTFTVTQGTPPPAPTSVPAAPSNLTVTAVDPNEIRLNWQDNSSNETGFEINNGVISKNVGPNITTYTWGDLAPQTYMCFKIRAYNSVGDSAWEPNVSPWYRCTTTPAATLFTWGDYLTYVAQYYHTLSGANLSLNCVAGSTGSFNDLVEGCLALAWKDAPPLVQTLLDTAFDALKCIPTAVKNPSEVTLGACISVSGAELVVLAIRAAFNAVPAGQAFLKTPFPVQP
jgi:Fibronectin type III domain